MRLFVALTPPAAALDELETATTAQRSSGPALRWVGRDRWHVTLAFLGDVDAEWLEVLRPELRGAAARHHPMALSFAGAGAFPRTTRGRVLWVGMGGDRDELRELASSVAGAARDSGIEQERRKFSPHLTLARGRMPSDLSEVVEPLAGFSGCTWTARDIRLVRSHLGPRPRYETLETYSLGTTPP